MRYIFIVTLLCLSSIGQSQPWLEGHGQDNFYELQSKFNEYWKDKEVKPGSGYKQFKRWEYHWQNRVNADGSFPPTGINIQKYQDYQRKLLRQKSASRTTNINWASEGPASSNINRIGVGRINCLAFHPTDFNKIYVGAAGGGFWYSNNGGDSWNTSTDFLSSMGISSILVHPTNPNIIYIATGDGNQELNYSSGVYKSINGGITWTMTALDWSVSSKNVIRKMLFNPLNPDSVFVASNVGILLLKDMGATSNLLFAGDFFDIEANPNSSSHILYASTNNGVYKSSNSGVNWYNTMLLLSSNRIELAIAPTNPEYLYAAASETMTNELLGFYLSEQEGENFALKNQVNLYGYYINNCDPGIGGFGRATSALIVDKDDENTIYIGGVQSFKSANKGEDWTIMSKWNDFICYQLPVVHADKHGFAWQGNILWEVNDGGIYKSINKGQTWLNKSNTLNIGHIAKIGISQSDATIITGHIDNGTKLNLNSGIWNDIHDGDGCESFINPNNSSTIFGSLYNGKIIRSYNSGASWNNIYNNIPSSGDDANFIAPIAMGMFIKVCQ